MYWFLLLYIIAALVFWYLELEKQNRQMITYRISELRLDDPFFNEKFSKFENEQNRKTAQYTGEGVVFLAVIILGAVFMYRAVRRQFTLQKQQENLMMAITHELKTPIAVAKLNLETLRKHQLAEEKKQKLLLMTLQEVERLNGLTANILISAQLEEGNRLMKDELDLSDLVKNAVHEYMNRHPARKWNVSITEDVDVTGDPLLLEIMVSNLLENAVKYSPPGSAIGCMLYEDQGHAVLKISDEGPGIPVKEKRKVFGKFYRIGNEQTRSAKGTGLGLYLCSRIAADHGATIRIDDNSPQGAIFLVRFEKGPRG